MSQFAIKTRKAVGMCVANLERSARTHQHSKSQCKTTHLTAVCIWDQAKTTQSNTMLAMGQHSLCRMHLSN